MKSRPGITRKHLAASARVALVTTLVILVVYGGVVALLDFLVTDRLLGQVDRQLASQLKAVGHHERTGSQYGLGIYGEPIDVWQVAPSGAVTAVTAGAPPLPPGAWPRPGGGSGSGGSGAASPGVGGPAPAGHASVRLGATQFRLMSIRHGDGWLVAGESLTELEHVESVLHNAEFLALPALIVAVFLGAVAIGLRSAAPIELARRRQLEFTADASHELRTPLSVIDAEIQLARSHPEGLAGEPSALDRLSEESHRLRRIVEDLLWLARFDSAPAPPGDEPIDVVTIAERCASRFGLIADACGLQLTLVVSGAVGEGSAAGSSAAGSSAGGSVAGGSVSIHAPAEWIDKLAGVLVDNACRYTPPGGTVRIIVGHTGSRAFLAVEDTGPGISKDQRAVLFDRFRRGTDSEGGHGLGLAIADSVVRSTEGRWRITDVAGGGARLEVSWPAR